jgi:hypothetical protein
MWCRLGNKRKREGKYKELLKNKSMCHLRKINFWKDIVTQKKNVHKPKNFNRLVATGH